MMSFTLKYSKNNDFHEYSFAFESQKRCFPRFFLFSILYSISVIFLCFQYRANLDTLI